MVIAAELSLLIVPDGAIPPNAGFVVPIPVPVLVPVPVPIPDPVPFPVPIPVPVPVPVPVPGGAMVGFVGVEELQKLRMKIEFTTKPYFNYNLL